MPGTSSFKPPSAWTLFPPTSTKTPMAEFTMQNPLITVQDSSVVEQETRKESTTGDPNLSTPPAREQLDRTVHRSGTYKDLERPDISAIRKQILEKASALSGAIGQDPLPDRTKRHSGGAKIPVRSSSRTENHEPARSRREHHSTMSTSDPRTSSTVDSVSGPRSRASSAASYHTNTTSLPPLQQRSLDEHDQLEPLCEEELNPGSFDLVAPPDANLKQYSLETRSELLFSADHLRIIFKDPSLFLRFTGFLSAERPQSVPILLYYLDAIKALKALEYANALAETLDPIRGFEFTNKTAEPVHNAQLEEKAHKAFEELVKEDLPAYITYVYIQTVSVSIQRRITGTLPPHLREASEGLAEVFCLTDPSRPDNPIVFASEEFHRTTQYGMSYVIGRNCRFLQGPKTNPNSVQRLRDTIKAGKEHCEVFLNYRRDGSPFMNLLMTAPLRDSRGTIRYYIGAQVDVSGLVKECSDLESLKRLVIETEHAQDIGRDTTEKETDEDRSSKSRFQELSEMLNMEELETVRRRGGRMRQYTTTDDEDTSKPQNWAKSRLLISSSSPDGTFDPGPLSAISGQLSGIYENYLLVRPYPSLRILFASPSLRIPGILQSPFMNKIGGSGRIREELTKALADGRGVTAKIRWLTSRSDTEGRNRWVHCTPLLGNNGAVGVWMIVVADDEDPVSHRRYRLAPPVDPTFGRTASQIPFGHRDDNVSLGDFARINNGRDSGGSGGGMPREREGVARPHSRTGGGSVWTNGSGDDGESVRL